MKMELTDAMAVLERTPRALDALLRGLPEPWLRGTEGPETWSPFDVVGHLIQGERTDWIPRLKIILEHGEARAFEPFDRFAQMETSRGKTLEELLDTFGALRAENVGTLRRLRLTSGDMGRRGKHPALGSVTLGQLLATWVAHDMTHVAQVSRVMAKQYADAVGPWSAYLSVLRDRTGG